MATKDPVHGQGKHRWGIYTLGFLTLAFVMLVLSTTQGGYTVLTLLGLIIGLGGAGWCSVRGFRVMAEHPLVTSLLSRPEKRRRPH